MKYGKWLLLLVLTVGLSGGSFAFSQAMNSDLLSTADEMLQTVVRIRGLEPKAPVAKEIKTKEEISAYLNQKIKQEYSPGEIKQQEKMLQILGLIPAKMDLLEVTLQLLKEQVEGFYDPEKKLFVLASWAPMDEQKPVMTHEFTHALQDQYFNINKIMKEDRAIANDDRTLAHQAICEGDAIAVMLEYITKRDIGKLPDMASIDMSSMMSSMTSQAAGMANIPQYLRENLIFPYSYGVSFLQKVWTKDPSWQSINKIYSDLPASSEQIIHPDKYFAHDNPKPVKEDNLAAKLGNNWKVTYKNVLGEFSLGLLLNLKLTDQRAKRSVLGWGGDWAFLLENSNGKSAVYVDTVWDSMNEADIFFLALQDWLQKTYPKAQKSNENAAGFSLVQNGEFHSLQRDGINIRFIIGLPETDGLKLFSPEQK
jgi:hypothetical protein